MARRTKATVTPTSSSHVMMMMMIAHPEETTEVIEMAAKIADRTGRGPKAVAAEGDKEFMVLNTDIAS
jgi:hypothetical protein